MTFKSCFSRFSRKAVFMLVVAFTLTALFAVAPFSLLHAKQSHAAASSASVDTGTASVTRDALTKLTWSTPSGQFAESAVLDPPGQTWHDGSYDSNGRSSSGDIACSSALSPSQDRTAIISDPLDSDDGSGACTYTVTLVRGYFCGYDNAGAPLVITPIQAAQLARALAGVVNSNGRRIYNATDIQTAREHPCVVFTGRPEAQSQNKGGGAGNKTDQGQSIADDTLTFYDPLRDFQLREQNGLLPNGSLAAYESQRLATGSAVLNVYFEWKGGAVIKTGAPLLKQYIPLAGRAVGATFDKDDNGTTSLQVTLNEQEGTTHKVHATGIFRSKLTNGVEVVPWVGPFLARLGTSLTSVGINMDLTMYGDGTWTTINSPNN